MSVGDSVWFIGGLALISACSACGSKTTSEGAGADARRAELAATPSLDRGTTDLSPNFSSTTLGGQTTILAILGDRLLADLLTHPTIELAPSEHLVAVVGGTRTALEEQIALVPGTDVLHTQYTVILPINDPGTLVIELDRADGSILTSTLNVFAPFQFATPPPHEVTSGDLVSFTLTPAGGEARTGHWSTWCDATADSVYVSVYYSQVSVDAQGNGILRYDIHLDCDAHLRVLLDGGGSYDPKFFNANEPSMPPPAAYRALDTSIHSY